MAIEQSKTPSGDMRSQAAHGAGGVRRNKAADSQDAAATGSGFSAVLAAADMGTSSETDAAVPDAALATAEMNAQAQKPAAPARASATRPDKPASRSEQTSDVGSAHKAQAGAVKTDDSGVPTPVGLASGVAAPDPVASALQGLLLQGAQGQPAPLQGDGEQGVAPQAFAGAGMGGCGFMKTSQLQQTLSGNAGKGMGASPVTAVAQRADAATDAQQAGGTVATSALAGVDARQVMPDRTATGQMSAAETGLSVMNLLSAMTSQTERFGAERRGQEDARGIGTAVQESWTAEPSESMAVAVDGSGMDEQPVQETVRYWMGADSKQQAELTVHDVGGGSVEVTIHMQGKEAQVSFRADEQQARDALQAASGQLKDMLSDEGLTLSGMSVGTSSSGAGDKHGARQGAGTGKTVKLDVGAAQVAAAVPGALGGASSALSGRGRSLDLFV